MATNFPPRANECAAPIRTTHESPLPGYSKTKHQLDLERHNYDTTGPNILPLHARPTDNDISMVEREQPGSRPQKKG